MSLDWSRAINPSEFVAQKFGLKYKQLAKLIYPTTAGSYRTFTITKKSGGRRVIDTPKPELKKIQRQLAEELSLVYKPKKGTHGFVRGRSIKTNAVAHVRKTFVFNLDLKDFFGSVHFGRVKNLLQSSPFNYSHIEATILAQICCHNGRLPQGAPTSPIISNIICLKLDAQLQSLASECKATYTRYADDITFSFTVGKKKIPRAIVHATKDDETVGSEVTEIIKANGFEINYEKVRLRGKNQKQSVTGLTVNEFPNVSRGFIRKTKSIIYAIKKFGAISAQKDYFDKYLHEDPLYPKVDLSRNDGSLIVNIAKGRLNFIQMARGRSDPLYRKVAYLLSEALGKPNEDFNKTAEELVSRSVFRLENTLCISQGSGFLLEGVGLVTNEHVVEFLEPENDELLEVYDEKEKKLDQCYFIFANKKYDLALFAPNREMLNYRKLKVGNDKYLRLGDEVLIVGYPDHAAGDSLYISSAKIVQIHMRLGVEYYITDAPILHGNSGGPILNKALEVIGVATIGAKQHDGEVHHYGFTKISNVYELINSPGFLSEKRYAEIRSLRPSVGGGDIFRLLDKTYCKECFVSKRRVSEVSMVRTKDAYNCKYCAKLFHH